MTDDLIARAVIERIDAVPVIDYCECGKALSAHTFWDDKIYDVQGRTCPSTIGGEYRFSASLTVIRHRDARAAVLDTALAALRASHERVQAERDSKRTETLARSFAEEYLTGHFRPLRDDEQKRFEQLVVVMLAFFAQAGQPAEREVERLTAENQELQSRVAARGDGHAVVPQPVEGRQ